MSTEIHNVYVVVAADVELAPVDEFPERWYARCLDCDRAYFGGFDAVGQWMRTHTVEWIDRLLADAAKSLQP